MLTFRRAQEGRWKHGATRKRGAGPRTAEGKPSEAKLFGHHWRDWVRKWVNRICQTAGVPKVTAHGMRGLHSTLAVENGVSAHVVAASLGHESSTTTMQSYVKPEAAAGARQRRVMTVFKGGRLAS
jgi:integrase